MTRCSTPLQQFLLATAVSSFLFATADAQKDPRLRAANAPHPAFAPVHDNPALPRVLLLGDSISIGYTPIVRSLLDGKANVHRAMENCGPTSKGVSKIDQWLGKGRWDVIHFNFGLHDLAHVDDSGNRIDPDQGHPQVPLETYEQNLRKIVHRLRETDATLIWCTTTPVPNGAKARRTSDVAPYNQVAARVMRMTMGEERVINDLYAFALPQLDQVQRAADVHFTPEGSKRLGEQVAAVIEEQLSKISKTTKAPKTPTPLNSLERRASPEDGGGGLGAIDTITATGIVFEDVDGDGNLGDADRPIPGVRVSNGREIVKTDSRGRYQLGVDDDTILFVIKPRGWRSPIRANQLPDFYYIHKPKGSPPLRFPGVAPTGPLPKSIDFPLYAQEEPSQFKVVLFGDPQPRNQQEVDYMSHDVIEELVGTDASFGVTLGDIVHDDLDVFEPQARAIAVLGIPWYNVIGNHDINLDARRDKHSDETFERVFGPSYYSFDHGPVHFIVLDDVEWLIDENEKVQYQGGLGPKQIAFVRRDLELIAHDQLVVLMMHIPLTDVRDCERLYRLIEQRPFCMSISAHRHFHEHRFINRDNGWRGPKPHHHVINVTVGGSWWSGIPDERGIPHTLMADGAPNGYSIMTFDGHEYQLDFKAASRPHDYQMSIYAPEFVRSGEAADVFVNVFNGSVRSKVEMSIGNGGSWSGMQQVFIEDPAFRAMRNREMTIREKLVAGNVPPDSIFREITGPKISAHLWKTALPVDLPAGTHAIRIRTIDMHGRTHEAFRVIRVEP